MLNENEQLEINDINVGHVNCYILGDGQGITFSVDSQNIYNIINQIGLINIFDSISETSEILNLVNPDNIIDYLVCNYSTDELRKQLEKKIKQMEECVSEEYRSKDTFAEYDKFWNEIRKAEKERVLQNIKKNL